MVNPASNLAETAGGHPDRVAVGVGETAVTCGDEEVPDEHPAAAEAVRSFLRQTWT